MVRKSRMSPKTQVPIVYVQLKYDEIKKNVYLTQLLSFDRFLAGVELKKVNSSLRIIHLFKERNYLKFKCSKLCC